MNKLIEIQFGSKLYGTDTPNSDTDIKGIYLPTAKEICLNSYQKTISTVRSKRVRERNNKDDIDIEFFSLDRFLKLLCEGQTVALDMLFSKEFRLCALHDILNKEQFICQTIYVNRNKILSRNINALIGYTKQQAAKYGIKGFRVHALKLVLNMFEEWFDKDLNSRNLTHIISLEKIVEGWDNAYIKIITDSKNNCHPQKFLEVCDKKIPFHMSIKEAYEFCKKRYDEYGHRALMAERNEGVDWKALSHAVRIASEAEELLETGSITFPRPDRELLIKIKTGQLPYQEVSELIEQGLENIKIASEKSNLRESPDYEWVDEFIYETYKRIVYNDTASTASN